MHETVNTMLKIKKQFKKINRNLEAYRNDVEDQSISELRDNRASQTKHELAASLKAAKQENKHLARSLMKVQRAGKIGKGKKKRKRSRKTKQKEKKYDDRNLIGYKYYRFDRNVEEFRIELLYKSNNDSKGPFIG